MSILIKEVLFEKYIVDVYIEGNIIKSIEPNIKVDAQQVISGKRKAIIPGLINGHAHSAMTLFRGFGDDMPLEKWLTEKIWPYEANLTEEDVYWGAKLACLEMIKSGTTCFNDMYWHFSGTAKAVEELGMRAVLSQAVMDNFDEKKLAYLKNEIPKWHEISKQWNSRVQFALGAHALYTCSVELLQWMHQYSIENQLLMHMHLAETQTEYNTCVEKYGVSPVKFLEKIGLLSPNLIVVHCLWMNEEEIQILGKQGVKIVHNPASNLKLASGYSFKYEEMKATGIPVNIGTDGCGSSNNLDMFEATKLASLLQKAWRFNPVSMPANEAFVCATENGGKILNQKIGKIAQGYLADVCLVDLQTPSLVPNFNLISNLVYSANGSCVDTVICDGKIVMQNKHVPGEEEIMEKASATAFDLMLRKDRVK